MNKIVLLYYSLFRRAARVAATTFLASLMIESSVGCIAKKRLSIMRIDEDFFDF